MSRRSSDPPILFSTDHELVVLKPAGMASELTTDPKGVSLVERLRRRPGGASVRLPHRLDRVTRGLIVAALTDEAIRFHNAQVQAGAWTKRYIARIPAPASADGVIGEHRVHLSKVKVGQRLMARPVRAGGQLSILEVEALAPAPKRRGEAHALIRLVTGRFHQIRAMLARLGLPLIGDDLYGGRAGPLYLEHASLRFRPVRAPEPITLFLSDDPGREPIAPALLQHLRTARETG